MAEPSKKVYPEAFRRFSVILGALFLEDHPSEALLFISIVQFIESRISGRGSLTPVGERVYHKSDWGWIQAWPQAKR